MKSQINKSLMLMGILIGVFFLFIISNNTSGQAPGTPNTINIYSDNSGGHENLLTYEFIWVTGWNGFSVPLNNSELISPTYFENIPGVVNISATNDTYGLWDEYVVGSGFLGNSFTFNEYDGYFAYCNQPVRFNITGERIWGLDYELGIGWNLLGWNMWSNGSVKHDIAPYVQVAGFPNIDDIAWWNETTQTYSHFIFQTDPNHILQSGESFFVWSGYNVSMNISDADERVDNKGWANQKLSYAYENATDDDFILIWNGTYTEEVVCNKTNTTIGGWKQRTTIEGNMTIENDTTTIQLILQDLNITQQSNTSYYQNQLINANITSGAYPLRTIMDNCSFLTSNISANPTNVGSAISTIEAINTSFYLTRSQIWDSTFTDSLIHANNTIYINDTTIIGNTQSDRSRTYNPVLVLEGATLYGNNIEFRGASSTIMANNSRIYISNSSLTRIMLDGIILTNSTLYLNDTTIRGVGNFRAIHLFNTSCNLIRANIQSGLFGFRNSTVTITDSTLRSNSLSLTDSDITMTNTTTEGLKWYSDAPYSATTVRAYNSYIDKDLITIYNNSTFEQYWLLDIRSEDSSNYQINGGSFKSLDVNGRASVYQIQWSKNETNFTDSSTKSIYVQGVNNVTIYLTKSLSVRVDKIPSHMNYTLSKGFNFIGVPYSTKWNVTDVLNRLGDGYYMFFRNDNGTFERAFSSNGKVKGDNFHITEHKGYIIYAPIGVFLQIPTSVTSKNVIKYDKGRAILSVPGEVRISLKEFFIQNPEISYVWIKNGSWWFYDRDMLNTEVLSHDVSIYIYAEQRSEWYWQTGLVD